eukprot:1718892-Prymnesium_polylepis.1
MPGSLGATDFLVGPTRVFVSKHNVGAKEVAEKLIGYFKAGSQARVVEKAPHSENASRSERVSSIASERRSSISENNVGAKQVVARLIRCFKAGSQAQLVEKELHPETLHMTRSASSKRRPSLRSTSSQECMLLYLEADLFQREAGHLTGSLCTQLHEALDAQQQIILLHPIRAVAFDHIIDTCPRELISRGLLRCIAVQLQPEPLELVSAGMLAKMLGGKPTPKRWQD